MPRRVVWFGLRQSTIHGGVQRDLDIWIFGRNALQAREGDLLLDMPTRQLLLVELLLPVPIKRL
jgi:hypothetical protein